MHFSAGGALRGPGVTSLPGYSRGSNLSPTRRRQYGQQGAGESLGVVQEGDTGMVDDVPVNDIRPHGEAGHDIFLPRHRGGLVSHVSHSRLHLPLR